MMTQHGADPANRGASPGAPDVAEHHLRLGINLRHAGNREAALAHLEQAVRLNPRLAAAHEALGQLYGEISRPADALRHARMAADLAPDQPDFTLSLGFVLQADGQAQEAWNIVQRLLEAGLISPRLAVLYSRLAPRFSRVQEALDLVHRLLQAPQFALPTSQAMLHFMAADLLDKLGRYDEAFTHARTGNALRKVPYDPGLVEQGIDELIAYFTPRKLRGLPRSTADSQKAVFIVGMPRSGSTLVEQVLGSHPAVHGGGEVTWITEIADHIWQRSAERATTPEAVGLPNCLDWVSLHEVDELAARYLKSLYALNPAASRITDKMLGNFIHLGLISMLLPQAKIIHCRRNALDTCLSSFMTDFASENGFSFDLATCGHYYRQYLRLMEHWKQVLDLPLLDVTYEEMVNDLEGQARRLLNFLELPWDERCTRFHESKRFVTTSSIEQVRRPLYQSSVGRWRHYERHLAPLRAALGDVEPIASGVAGATPSTESSKGFSA